MYKKAFFLSALILIPFLIEGLGLKIGSLIFPYFYFVLPSLIFFILALNKNDIHFPKKITFIFFIFILFSGVSTFFFSLDKQFSFESWLFFLSSFLIFIFFYNIKTLGKNVLIFLITTSAIIFTITSLFIKFEYLSSSFVAHAYQFIYPFSQNHNHLGDFLGLSLFIFLYFALKSSKKIFFIPFIIYAPFFYFAGSRSAQLAFLATFIIFLALNRKFLKSKIILSLITLIFLITAFFTLNSWQIRQNSQINDFYSQASRVIPFETKNILSNRNEYLKQAVASIRQNPYWGVGLNNFGLASRRNLTYPFTGTNTSHNIFVDLLTEGGLFTFIFFSLIVIFILKSGFKKTGLFFFLFLYMLFDFQTTYTYRIFSFFLLFMAIAGVIYEEKNNLRSENFYGVLSTLLLFIVWAIITSFMFFKLGNPNLSILFYPFNRDAYPQLITNEKDYNQAVKLTSKYLYVAPDNLATLQTLGDFYEKNNNYTKALSFYEKAYFNNPFVDFAIIEKIYALKEKIYSKKEAHNFLTKVFSKYTALSRSPSLFKTQIEKFCFRENEISLCQSSGWL